MKTINCFECSVEFLQTRKDKAYCSKRCAKKNYNHNNFVELLCPRCNSIFKIEKYDHNRRIKLGRDKIYCSKRCASAVSNENRYEKRLLKCLNCGKEETVNETDDRQKYCSQECYKEHDKERLAELAKRVGKESAEKIGQTLREKYKNGYIHPWLGRHHKLETIEKFKNKIFSTETREKMSLSQVENILKGVKPTYIKGIYFSKKMNKEFYYRSSWELSYMQYLDRNSEIDYYDYECTRIQYKDTQDHKRWYIPDFVVRRKDSQKIVEIKPEYLTKKEKNLLKFSAAREYCQQNNMTFEVLTEKELKQLGILF